MKKTIRTYYVSIAVFVLFFFGVLIVYSNILVFRYSRYIYHTVATVPTSTITLVLGGGMETPGVMSDMQTDRVLEAVRLYKAGKTDLIIMSGDDGALRDNEVDFMRERAIAEGVPAEKIEIDPHAYRTYLSCYRAKHEYAIDQMLVITQNFHLSRALYLCNEMGIRTLGLSSDLHESYQGMWKIEIREILARVKAVWQVMVTRPTK